MKVDLHSDSELRKIYDLKNIAVVGMSKNEEKAAHYVPKYLIQHGYNVIPVNPTINHINPLLMCKKILTLSMYLENLKMYQL